MLDLTSITIFYTFAGTVLKLVCHFNVRLCVGAKTSESSPLLCLLRILYHPFRRRLVPSYILNVRYLHLNDTIWIFLLPGMFGAFNAIILRTFIQTTVSIPCLKRPASTALQTGQFTGEITMPLSKAGLATLGPVQRSRQMERLVYRLPLY